jgi:hypothetical protein
MEALTAGGVPNAGKGFDYYGSVTKLFPESRAMTKEVSESAWHRCHLVSSSLFATRSTEGHGLARDGLARTDRRCDRDRKYEFQARSLRGSFARPIDAPPWIQSECGTSPRPSLVLPEP